ncbi:MAG TPA: FG-GAP-like repeat-containing protein [Pyrinomonadaceae bacterium]|nr:FG-GAP-like repeat-containing protein [Pyrinomonadaceae bacterium]
MLKVCHTFVFSLILLCASVATAQTNVDPTFNAVPSRPFSATGTVPDQEQAIQADGKVLIWGGALAVDGVAVGKLARLNTDGSRDAGFAYCQCGIDVLRNAAPLADGKILAAGLSNRQAKVIRLNSDGSIDPTFVFQGVASPYSFSAATVVAVRDDGKFYVKYYWAFMNFGGETLFRFNADGSLDSSFTSVAVGDGRVLTAIELLPNGDFFLAFGWVVSSGYFSSVSKFTSSGALDSTWTPPAFPNSSPPQVSVAGLSAAADGSLLIAGWFSSVNGAPKSNLVRLLPAGNVDLNFTAENSFRGSGVKLLPNGKILFSIASGIGNGYRLIRLNSDGSLDSTYTMDAAIEQIANSWSLDASERTVFNAGDRYVRLLSNGSLDTTFSTNVNIFGRVNAMARQADGKVVVTGEFTKFNGTASPNIVRVNDDGTLDPTFDAGTGFDQPPTRLILQPDGKVIAIGTFTQFNGNAVPTIIRLLANGSLDSSFNVVLDAGGDVQTAELLSDGRVYIGGDFLTVSGTSRPGAARINADGSLDSTFNALIGGSPTITALAVQPDGKLLIGGTFSGIGGFNRSRFARVDSTGALDQAFNPANTSADNIYLASTSIYTSAGASLFRRDLNGNVDPTFVAPIFKYDNVSSDARIYSVVPQGDGSVIVGGKFDSANDQPRFNVARLAPNGKVDRLFLPAGADAVVRTILPSSSDKVLVGGEFTQIGSISKAGVGRLNVVPYRKVTPFDFDGDGRSDFVVYRPSSSLWYQLSSNTYNFELTSFGIPGDVPLPSDYDGDGRTDVSIFRPSSGDWWYRASGTGTQLAVHLASAGDRFVPTDFDGDGKTDFVTYTPSNSVWRRYGSISGSQPVVVFGIAGDIPLVGDFDGDGRGDLAIFRPSTGDWWYAASGSGNAQRATHFGANGDVPVPADYDGDGKSDMAVFRPSTGVWYILNSSDYSATIVPFGLGTDKMIPADYDGDGKADIAVFRPSTGIWYILRSSAGFLGLQWGISTDAPAANSFIYQGSTSRPTASTRDSPRVKPTYRR